MGDTSTYRSAHLAQASADAKKESRSRYQFEATESDDELEDELDTNLDETLDVTRRLKALAMAAGCVADSFTPPFSSLPSSMASFRIGADLHLDSFLRSANLREEINTHNERLNRINDKAESLDLNILRNTARLKNVRPNPP